MCMIDYASSCNLGSRGEDFVISFLSWFRPTSVITRITSRHGQKEYGDFYWNLGDKTYSVDVKTEESDKYGNFFFEHWSNKHRETPGWGFTSNMDLLIYLFLKSNKYNLLDFKGFKYWAYELKNIYEFPLKPQQKYRQINDSWGYCVPISLCRKIPELKLTEFNTEKFYCEFYNNQPSLIR